MQNSLIGKSDSLSSIYEDDKSIPFYYKIFRIIFYIAYAIFPIFKKPLKISSSSITAQFHTLPTWGYFAVQISLQILLLLIRARQYQKYLKVKTRYHKYRLILITITTVIIIIFDIVNYQYMIDLLLRPIILIAYYQKSYQAFKVYCKVVRYNWRYYCITVASIFIFAGIGYLLFNNYDLNGQKNIFNSIPSLLFNLVILQTTSNFPDIALPYYEINKLSIIYFVVFLLINWTIIYNIIISSSFQIYDKISKQNEIQQQFKLKILQQQQKQEDKNYSQIFLNFKEKHPIISVLLFVIKSKVFRTIKWLSNVTIFYLVCGHPPNVYPLRNLVIMLVISIVLGLQSFIKIIAYRSDNSFSKVFKYMLRSEKYLFYQFLATIVIIVGTVIILVQGTKDYQFYPYLILLRLPFIIKPLIYVIFKKYIKKSERTQGKQNILNLKLVHNFLPKFLTVFYMLILIMTIFSAIGQLLFDGLITEESRSILVENQINPRYIYLNFNSTISALFTLFSLLVVNNWNQLVKMYITLSQNKLYQFYFIFYFIFAILISYYILIATIIQFIFNVSNDEDNNKNRSMRINSAGYSESMA